MKCPTWNSNFEQTLIPASNSTLSCVFEGFFISLKACHVHYHLYVKTNQEKVDIKRKAYVVLCCIAVKSNVHFRTSAQNVSYFQLMWKLAPFFRKIKIIRNIKLILALKINFQNQILEIFDPTYSKKLKLSKISKMHYITSFSFNNTTSKMRSNLR